RSLGIPSRLTFSDVKNHISTPALKKLVGGDVFHYHAYAEVFLEGKWVKATPVFNSMLCWLFGIEPLEFDGVHDAILQSYDKDGNKCLEFIQFHGTFDDVPYTQCVNQLRLHHPLLFLDGGKTATGKIARETSLADS
ncbi:MAG: transglutaminase domain-containing protein, partial [Gammaproteobacteria bacterium]